MNRLSAETFAAVVAALREHRIAKRAAEIAGVHRNTASRIAKKEKITLISLSEHMSRRRATPEFIARQAPAARKGASQWLKAQHADPKFREKCIEGARRSLKRLNRNAAFREASSKRLKKLCADPAFRAKQIAAVRAAATKRRLKLRNDTPSSPDAPASPST